MIKCGGVKGIILIKGYLERFFIGVYIFDDEYKNQMICM
jgi:hypothetical protein